MRLKLLAYNEALAEALFAALQDPALYEYIPDAPPSDFEAHRARCKRLEHTYSPDGTQRWLNWAIELDGNVAGYVQATVYDFATDRSRAAEFAYSVVSSEWGKGVAFEACTKMLEILRTDYQVTTLWLTILKNNARSISLAQRLGLQEVSAVQYPYTNFAEGDVVMFGRL